MARSAIHPGEHLAEAIEAMGITADRALHLGRDFDTSPEFWMNLQQLHELLQAARHIDAGIGTIPRGKSRRPRMTTMTR